MTRDHTAHQLSAQVIFITSRFRLKPKQHETEHQQPPSLGNHSLSLMIRWPKRRSFEGQMAWIHERLTSMKMGEPAKSGSLLRHGSWRTPMDSRQSNRDPSKRFEGSDNTLCSTLWVRPRSGKPIDPRSRKLECPLQTFIRNETRAA